MGWNLGALAVNLSDGVLGPIGRFRLVVVRLGLLVEEMDEPNLVVTSSKALLAALLGGASGALPVSVIGFGTSLTAAAVGNTSLTGSYTKSFDSVTYPVSGSVQFNFSLASGEANGTAIGEFGLLASSGVLFARKVRSSALNKDTDLSLSGSWTITF